MEEETRFARPSSPFEDYRQTTALADSTTNGRNSDPVAISYRQISSTSGSGGTTTSGYGSSGSEPMPIDMRPRQPEPPGQVGLHVDTEFDAKLTDEYANLDDVRDHNYHLARSPDRLQHSANPVYAGGVPNNARQVKQQKKKACCSCVLQCIVGVLIVMNIVGLGLGAFNLANTFSIGTYTGVETSTNAAAASSGDLSGMVEQLKQELQAIQEDFMTHNSLHSSNFSYLQAELLRLQVAIDDITQPTTPPSGTEDGGTMSSLDVTTSLSDTSAPPTTPSPPPVNKVAVPLYENCTVNQVRTCTVGTGGILGTAPHRYSSCSTPPMDLTAREGYLKDVFCSVSSIQDMPVTATLRYTGGEWVCTCQVIEVQNALQMTLDSFQCHMYERRCPRDIYVPFNP